ncbi:hypothetical protein NM208_g4271 [Fusarium decemcellulare]|uniref:Uncharacterized protein n=1 Tax=Fusarium decemcellulare TaxID=57161 RepID=A0ACC1SLD6_9HYPO|nr:hypothetical protein NM208_g4271 [Fusarium decemcellulare]
MVYSQILLRGGTLLIHDNNNRVVPQVSDLLVQEDHIHLINDIIDPPEGARIIDCHGSLVSPGLIDTHKHLWQSQQKGLHADQILADYFCSGNLASSHYAPDDIFWGVLASALESIDAGTTTVVDHAHVNYSSDHSYEVLRATFSSGIRSIFCYCVHPLVTSWQPELKMSKDLFPSWVMDTFRELAAVQPFGPNGRVRLGSALDVMFVAETKLRQIFDEVHGLGAHLITCHDTRPSKLGAILSAASVMHKNNLLGPDVLLSHANKILDEELRYVRESGAHLTSTPLSEMQMGHGHPVCLLESFFPISSIGTDSNSICTSYIPTQMTVALLATPSPTVEDAYNLGTILGAHAIGMSEKIGSLAVGKKADIVVFHGHSPAMVAAAHHNPVTAIVLHSSVRDVQTVIVDGVIRKDEFSLRRVKVSDKITPDKEQRNDNVELLGWADVAKGLDQSRRRLERIREEHVDEEVAKNGLAQCLFEVMALTAEK